MINSMQPVLLKLKPNTNEDDEGPDIDIIKGELTKQFKNFIENERSKNGITQLVKESQ